MLHAWETLWRASVGPAVAAFFLTLFAIRLFAPMAREAGWVDRPGGRKTHADPTPVIGGLAILLGSLPFAIATFQLTPNVIGLVVATAIIISAGIIDDLIELRWYVRLAAQCAAGLSLVYVGGVRVEMIGPLFGTGTVALGPFSAPFTVLATVGVMNAMNMTDGVDGLAGSLTAVTLSMLIAAAIYSGNDRLGHGLLLLLGALLAFLTFNLRTPWRPRANVFLGNAGSEFLGLVIAWASFRMTQNYDHPVAPALAPFFIALPVIDCLVLMVRRIRNGRSPFSAGRDHMHHLLLDAGWSATDVVILMSLASMMAGLGAALALRADASPISLVAAFGVLTIAYYLLTSRRERCLKIFVGLHHIRHSLFPPLSFRERQATYKSA
jgi:UDP-GlcNAc:undecaprenyl-phosphate GlcNAc-1-phosphate transferase